MPMTLANELKALGSNLDASVFEATLLDVYTLTNRDSTVDNFLCRPWDHQEVSDAVIQRFGLDESYENLIIRQLLNMRKRGHFKQDRLDHKPRLDLELQELGIKADRKKFEATLERIFVNVYEGFSVEQLQTRRRDSMYFCRLVRTKLKVGRSRAVDELILRSLKNLQRHGKLSLRDRAKTAP